MAWLEYTINTDSKRIESVATALTAAGFPELVIEDQAEFEEFLEGNRNYWDYIDEDFQQKLQGLSRIKIYLEDTDTAGAKRLDAVVEKLNLTKIYRTANQGIWLGNLYADARMSSEDGRRFYRQAFETIRENDCADGDTIDAFNKRVNKSGVSPTVTTRPEGFKTAILVVDEPMVYDGYNGVIRSDGSCVGTLTTNCGADLKRNGQGIIESEKRIRKLTPKECWRLMGFDDEAYERAAKVTTHSKLYKQAGNSIVVDVLMEIFRGLF